MAGCLPAYLPVVGAAVEALAAPEFNLVGVATTTGSATPIVIVNGPIVAALGMNVEGNVLGPGNRANAAIGGTVPFLAPFLILCAISLMALVVGVFASAAALRQTE